MSLKGVKETQNSLIAPVYQSAKERLVLALPKCFHEGVLYSVAGCSPHYSESTTHADSP